MSLSNTGIAPPSIRDRLRWKRQDLEHRLHDKAAKTTMRFARWLARDSNLLRHASRELLAAGYQPKGEEGPNQWIQDNLLDLLATFSLQGHSGFSAGFCTRMLIPLMRYEPLVPLTGEDSEWNKCDDTCWQNNRCSHVFKGADGKAYDIQGKIFREPSGSCYTSRDSRVYVTFPYTPKVEYVDVPAKADA